VAVHLELCLFELQIGTPVNTPLLGNVHTNFGLSAPVCFRVRSLYGTMTDRRTDRRTDRDRRAGPALQPTGTTAQ